MGMVSRFSVGWRGRGKCSGYSALETEIFQTHTECLANHRQEGRETDKFSIFSINKVLILLLNTIIIQFFCFNVLWSFFHNNLKKTCVFVFRRVGDSRLVMRAKDMTSWIISSELPTPVKFCLLKVNISFVKTIHSMYETLCCVYLHRWLLMASQVPATTTDDVTGSWSAVQIRRGRFQPLPLVTLFQGAR